MVRPSGKWSGRQDSNLRSPGPQTRRASRVLSRRHLALSSRADDPTATRRLPRRNGRMRVDAPIGIWGGHLSGAVQTPRHRPTHAAPTTHLKQVLEEIVPQLFPSGISARAWPGAKPWICRHFRGVSDGTRTRDRLDHNQTDGVSLGAQAPDSLGLLLLSASEFSSDWTPNWTPARARGFRCQKIPNSRTSLGSESVSKSIASSPCSSSLPSRVASANTSEPPA